MSPPRGDFDGFSDICDGLTATSTSPGHDNCRQEPALAALLAEDPDFEFEDDNNSYSPNTGNSNLKEETADTYTLGITMAPQSVENLFFAVDYYNISVADAIDEISNADIINQCYNSSSSWGSDNHFCNDITRDSEGNIIKILQREYNLNELTARGVDIAVQYGYELGEMGKLSFKADYTHVIEQSTTYEGNDGLETANFAGFGSPKDKLSASVSWTKDNLRVRWSSYYLGEFTHSYSREASYNEYIEANDQRCAEQTSECIANPETLMYQYFDSYIKHNLSFSYAMDMGGSGQLNLSAGINNVFDDKGVFTLGGRGNFNSLYGGGAGRFYYLGAEYSF
jgi:outer membrane receptor protein involved in Fe transport